MLDELNEDFTNSIIETLSKDLNEKFKNEKCEVHKELSRGVITILIDENNKSQTKKTEFCCKEFENSIDTD